MGNNQILANIIAQLQKYGMPVQFLRYVNNHMTTELGDSDEVSGFSGWETLKLSSGTITPLKKASPSLPLGENTAIQTLYHEATHAYINLRKEDPNVKTLMSYGKQYYDEAPLKRGEKADDPERLFHEAAASYVGHRATSWWSALESIVTYLELIRRHGKTSKSAKNWAADKLFYHIDLFVKKVREIPKEYNKAMSHRTFGYEDEWKGLSRVQTETTKKMPDRLKKFCDTHILEDKIPDNFSRSGILLKRYGALLNLIKPLTHPPRSVHGGGQIPGPQGR